MYSNEPKFKHCILFPANVRDKKYLQIQLLSHLGKKRFSCGQDNRDNYQKALKAGLEVDRYCDQCLLNNKPINLIELKNIVKKVLQPHLIIVTTDKVAPLWQDYVDYHLALNCWSDSYLHTHITRINNLVKNPDFPDNLEKPSEVLQWILDGDRSVRTSKDRFKQLVGAVDWASKNDRIKRHYGLKWRDCLSSLNSKISSERKHNNQARSKTDEDIIDPFTLEEIERILSALENETYCRQGKSILNQLRL